MMESGEFMMAGNFLSLTGAVFTVILVLVLAYFSSRLLGKSWNRMSAGRHLNVLEYLQVGNDRQLLLVKVLDRVFLVGVSAAGIQMLTEIEGDFEETALPQSEIKNVNFMDILKTHAGLQQQKKRGDK